MTVAENPILTQFGILMGTIWATKLFQLKNKHYQQDNIASNQSVQYLKNQMSQS